MKIEVSKNMLTGALAALGKLVSRMGPVEEHKSVLIVLENGIMRFHTFQPCDIRGKFIPVLTIFKTAQIYIYVHSTL